jgi:hypothetical protein
MQKIKIRILSVEDLRKSLVKEALSIPAGSFKQVLFDCSTKELSFSEPMTGLGAAQLTNSSTIGFLDSLQSERKDYETENQMIDAALEEEWFSNVINAYKMSDESVTIFK